MTSLGAQLPQDTSKVKEPVEIDFLFNYYEQEGDHAAVTGGLGTQELTDRAGKIVVSVPLDSVSRLEVNTGLNIYSSASTDRIDAYLSTASARDARFRQYYTYSRKNKQKGKAFSVQVGGSVESDYISRSLALTLSKTSPDENREFKLSARAFLDNWIIILPEELRDTYPVWMRTDKRHSYSLGLSWAQVISPRLQANLQTEMVVQHGLLSTPFHRAYVQGQNLPKVERFPGLRWKLPFSLRLHYFGGDRWVLRSFYRFYMDNFQLFAHTASLEVSWKMSPFFSVYPFYRFHTQTAAYFFQPYGEHLNSASYYSSDWDLAEISSHKVGVGIHYAPLYGVLRAKINLFRRKAIFQSVDLRGARYLRSDGLNAWLFSLQAAFQIH